MITEQELVKLQQTELAILIDFDKFCNQHGLTYYLIGGALLGAKRYGKFIPWDDDVDVAMPREDYEKLQTIWQNDTNKQYYLQSAYTDPKFSRCILKVRKNGTKIVENTTQGIGMHEGIYIDIFPIDYAEEFNQKRLDSRAKQIRRLMSLRTIRAGYNSKKHALLKKVTRFFTCGISLKSIDKKIHELCSLENHNTRNYGVLFLHNYTWDKQFHKIEVFGKGSKIDFCGYSFNAPADTNAFLSKVFGEDYMKEPENKKQPHNYVLVDFGTDE